MRTVGWLILTAFAVALAGAQPGPAVGPPFTVTISATQPSVKLGQPAMIHIVLTSNTHGQLTLPEDRNADHAEMNYLIFVERSGGKAVPDTDLGAKLRSHVAATSDISTIIKYLDFGEEVAENADLTNVARIAAPGDYVVYVERDDPMYRSLHIKSNRIVIHVEP